MTQTCSWQVQEIQHIFKSPSCTLTLQSDFKLLHQDKVAQGSKGSLLPVSVCVFVKVLPSQPAEGPAELVLLAGRRTGFSSFLWVPLRDSRDPWCAFVLCQSHKYLWNLPMPVSTYICTHTWRPPGSFLQSPSLLDSSLICLSVEPLRHAGGFFFPFSYQCDLWFSLSHSVWSRCGCPYISREDGEGRSSERGWYTGVF